MIRNALAVLTAAAALPVTAQTTAPVAPADNEARQSMPMSREVVSDQASGRRSTDATEAIRDVAGVTPSGAAGTSFDQILIRGVRINPFANYRLDGGVPLAGVVTPPTENKERLETLKGANALMYGVASPAGIINLVSKRAGGSDVTSVNVQATSFGQAGVGVDIGRRLGEQKQVGLRLNASATHLENGIKDTGGRATFASLGLDVRATSRLKIQGDLEYYERDTLEQPAIAVLPAVNGVIAVPRAPDPRNFLAGPWAVFSSQVTNAQIRADYQLSAGWNLLAQMGSSDAYRLRNQARVGNYDPVTGANGLVTVPTNTVHAKNTFGRFEAQGRFQAMGLDHALTFGFAETHRDTLTYGQNSVNLAQRQNIFDPILLNAPNYTRPYTALPFQSSQDKAVYAYDTITLVQGVKLLAGIRQTEQTEYVGTTSQKSNVTSPGVGILWDLTPRRTVYASYLKGLEAGGIAPPQAANANVVLAPSSSTQKEFGLRDTTIRGLNLNVSYFEIERANNIINPLNNVFDYFGTVKYQGVELGGGYAFSPSWRINGGAVLMKARQDAPTLAIVNGKTPDNVARIAGSLRLVHNAASWMPGLSINGGGRFISRRAVDPQNQGYIPGFAVFDAGLTYATRTMGQKVTYMLSMDNIANRRYWNAEFAQQLLPGMDRKVSVGAKFDF